MKKIVLIIILLFNINVYATSTIVMDTNTGRVLYENNAYEKRLIASTTKIMTFVVAYEYAKDYLDLEIEAGNEILKMYGTSIYISLNEKMTLRDLLYGLMMRSGNDAAVVIANFVGGSEENFVKLMNRKAQFIGMNNTIFSNSHGLDENTKNYSTAYDMAKLSTYANKIPFYKEVTSTKYRDVKTNIKSYSWTNRNKLVFIYPNFVSGKTGYTPKAGKTFVSTAKKDNLELTIVSLNDSDYYNTHQSLYNRMYDKYQNYLLVSKDIFNIEHSNYYINNDIYYPMTKEEKNNVLVKLISNSKGVFEKIVVNLNNVDVYEEKVYLRDNTITQNKRSIWQKIGDLFTKIF